VKARVSLDVSVVAVVENTPMLEVAMFTPRISLSLEPQQYSPPALYTLHGSLLI
jgi:hypothetical protein